MRDYLTDFFKEFAYEPKERVTLAVAFEKIAESREARAKFTALIKAYECDVHAISEDAVSIIVEIAECASVHVYTAILLTVICLSKKLRERLLALGLSKKIVNATLSDFTYKMRECEILHGVVGTEHWVWYTRFFALRLIAIGRLQFQLTEFGGGVYKKGEKLLKKGDKVLAVHIPRNDAPLTERACAAAYKDAKALFCGLLKTDDIAFTCSSWLLYPKNRDFLPPSSNIYKFMNRYDIIEVHEYPKENNPAIPFLFLVKGDTPPTMLPRDTSLRAAYAEHLTNGGSLGYGVGVFFLENEK